MSISIFHIANDSQNLREVCMSIVSSNIIAWRKFVISLWFDLIQNYIISMFNDIFLNSGSVKHPLYTEGERGKIEEIVEWWSHYIVKEEGCHMIRS